MTGFHVEPAALERFAQKSDGRRSAFDTEYNNIQAAHVGREAFGRIPGIGARISEAYEQHVQACAEGISSAAEAMAAIASGVRAVVINYQNAEASADDDLKGLHSQLDNITIRGVR